MNKKHLKFLLIHEAIDEIKNTLMMRSELRIRNEIMPHLDRFGGFEIKKYAMKVHPLEFDKRNGLWIKSHHSEKFYHGDNLLELFVDQLRLKPSETIAGVYSDIQWVKANVADHPETGFPGLIVETEMEKYECVQCGNCCLNLSDAYQTSVLDSDVKRWRRENRTDILEWVDSFLGLNDIWINPRTGNFVGRCPWLRKLPKKDKYLCRIHDTKPEHCQSFPKSKRHALENGCKGFPAN